MKFKRLSSRKATIQDRNKDVTNIPNELL